MLLVKARVRDYRSVNDTEEFEVEPTKTLLVGVNEAGKTAVLRALQTIRMPEGTEPLDALRDYPRSRYTEVQSGQRSPNDIVVAEATYKLTDVERAGLATYHPELGTAAHLKLFSYMSNNVRFSLEGVPWTKTYEQISKDLARLKAHLAKQADSAEVVAALDALTAKFQPGTTLEGPRATGLDEWLESALPLIDETNETENKRFDTIRSVVRYRSAYLKCYNGYLQPRVPLFVYYSTFFTVKPRIHLSSLAARQASGEVDEEYDFGNLCLLKLCGFTAQELSDLAKGAPADVPANSSPEQVEAHKQAVVAYEKQIDQRHYRLNAASVALTKDIRRVWGDENVTLRFVPDGQLLKVVVVDDLGVEVELDQRSEGFRWLVSFFVVFKAQAADDLDNAILLLDEPGLSLHALKQQEFRKTVSLLAEDNQIIYTTHSPFMVGTDELDLVRIIEMADRETGTKVHTRLVVDDPRSVYPLQAALGYELAQSLFAQKRNLVCEGLTDMFYVEALNAAQQDAGKTALRDGTALVPAQSASKVVYYCTLLVSQKLRVAALLDSDQAGEKAAQQDDLVHLLKEKQILRTKDFHTGAVSGPEIEDLLRDTLVAVARDDLGWDVSATASQQPARRIVDIFVAEIADFSKYRLARAFLRWLSKHDVTDLTVDEQSGIEALFVGANKALA
ncbi:hypothetical protein GCM10022237_21330 [Nocardioides ginsengisoli]|uniref:ATP-dependent endonuclease n=1 Tax=Nocardioides ginsengisoli TaxID=363868 RepID=A0ABW3W2L8_9ACTN